MVCMTNKLLHHCKPVLARMYVHFVRWVWYVLNRCLEYQVLFDISLHHDLPSNMRRACMCASCTRSFFIISVVARGWGVSASLCRTLVAWRGVLFFTEGAIRVLSCVFSIFDVGGSVCKCMCVYTHTHTHTPRWVLDVSPGVGTRHLQVPKNQDGINVGVCVQSTHVCMLLFFFRKQKQSKQF